MPRRPSSDCTCAASLLRTSIARDRFFSGDNHAVTAANNLLAAAIDARMLHEATTPDDDVLFDRLCPAAKDGSRKFSSTDLRGGT